MGMYQKRKIRAEKKNNNQEEKLTKVVLNWFPGHITIDDDMAFKDYLLMIRKELEIIEKRKKEFDEEKHVIFEMAKRPSTITRLKVLKKVSKRNGSD